MQPLLLVVGGALIALPWLSKKLGTSEFNTDATISGPQSEYDSTRSQTVNSVGTQTSAIIDPATIDYSMPSGAVHREDFSSVATWAPADGGQTTTTPQTPGASSVTPDNPAPASSGVDPTLDRVQIPTSPSRALSI